MTWTTESQRDNQGRTTKFQNIQNTVHELISLASKSGNHASDKLK